MKNKGGSAATAGGHYCGRAFVAGLMMGLALLAAGLGIADETPLGVVESLTSGVLAVLQDETATATEKRQQIEELVYPKVDVETVTRLVLARHWRRFSEGQRAEFVRQFRQHLSRTYGDNVEYYDDQRVVITGEREEPRGDRTVQTRIVREGAADVLVDYRLRQKEGKWRIIDVVVERVSMVANFRSQFQEILSGGGPEKLLRLLREKNAGSEKPES